MRADIALFFLVIGAIAITGLIVRNHGERPIAATFTGLASVVGVATTGNPQFFAEAKGYNG
jgi:hypothetical protein